MTARPRYRFLDEIVLLTLDGTPQIEVAKRFDAGEDVFTGPLGPEQVPESMLLGLMAMTGGHLIFRHLAGGLLPLLLKVPECRFDDAASAGDRLGAGGGFVGGWWVAVGPSAAGRYAWGRRTTRQSAGPGRMSVC